MTRNRRYGMTVVSAEVDPAELEAAGWHFEDCCPMLEPELAPGSMDAARFRAGVQSLHRQAHPAQPRAIELCREQPCASFPFGAITGSIGRR